MRRAIANQAFPTPDGSKVNVTVSIGLAAAEPPWNTGEIMERADQAMYAAKGRGRNRVEVARQR